MGDGQSKESASKQSDSLGGEDVNKAIIVQAMGKSEQSTTGFSESGPGNHNSQGTEQSPNKESPPKTEIYTACTKEGEKNTYGASSLPLTNEEVTREAKVKVGKPPSQQKTGKNLTMLEKVWA